jgi:hypothetical protein
MRRLLICVAIALVGTAVPAAATPPADTTIRIDTILPPDGSPAFGPFTATGSVVCPRGDTVDLLTKAAGSQSGDQLQLLVLKRFTCADGSGSFDMLLRVHLVFEPFSDVATWTVVGGTGRYERLHGTGTLVGTPTATGVVDTLTGRTHLD